MYNVTIYPTIQFNEPSNIYNRRQTPAGRQYIPGNSYHTYKMAKEAIGPRQSGYWLMLFAGSGTLKHTQKMGDAATGFGDIKTLLQTALQYQCLSMVLVNHYHDYYQANSRDMKYNINLITAACNISVTLLDHLVIEPEGYFSYRDNGLLTYN